MSFFLLIWLYFILFAAKNHKQRITMIIKSTLIHHIAVGVISFVTISLQLCRQWEQENPKVWQQNDYTKSQFEDLVEIIYSAYSCRWGQIIHGSNKLFYFSSKVSTFTHVRKCFCVLFPLTKLSVQGFNFEIIYVVTECKGKLLDIHRDKDIDIGTRTQNPRRSVADVKTLPMLNSVLTHTPNLSDALNTIK